MIRHLTIVAMEFRLAGILLAIPALATLFAVADLALSFGDLPSLDHSAPLDIETYGLIALMVNALRILGPILHALAGLAGWALALLAIAATLVLALAALLYLTGRGIGQHASWARILAGLMSLCLALISFAVMTALRRDLAPFAAAPLGLSFYTLWVLIWRFA